MWNVASSKNIILHVSLTHMDLASSILFAFYLFINLVTGLGSVEHTGPNQRMITLSKQ
jgi:hypothetical protein